MKITAKEYQAMLKPKKKPTARWQTPVNPAPINCPVLIGIDPGSVTTGFAMLVEGQPPLLLGFPSHCEAIMYALNAVNTYGQQNVHFVIEDARKAPKNAWFAKQNGSKKDQGAGYIKALSKDWQQFCEKVAKVSYALMAPNPARTKWEADRFLQEFGIKTLKGEHHLRDAFLLVNELAA